MLYTMRCHKKIRGARTGGNLKAYFRNEYLPIFYKSAEKGGAKVSNHFTHTHTHTLTHNHSTHSYSLNKNFFKPLFTHSHTHSTKKVLSRHPCVFFRFLCDMM